MALRKRRPARGRGASLVQGLGTYGYARIERNFLAGLVLREPILLWGPHGAGKTELCRRAAEALGLRFWAYDASKSMFEDVIGFPDPSSLESGTVGYVRTPLSIWDKEAVLIDELNRAQPSLQSKWLEVVHARQIMGCPLPQLQQLFAAMNPPSYAGTNPLDEALAGRFIAILRIPELKDMSPEDARSVIRREREVPLAGPAAAAFLAAVEGARARLAAILPSVRAGAEEYVVEVVQAFQARDVAIDSRRAGMLRRLIEARLCVE
ncbi:AAA family ATPase [bacterium]|nr:AAA family ATPase [bacterium]